MELSDVLPLVHRSPEPYDALDLVAGFGALHLVPENAHHLLRLDVAAAAAARLPPLAGHPQMSNQRWRLSVNSPPVADLGLLALDGPAEYPFTEALTFHGGSYVVFPGVEAEAPYTVRHLIDATVRLARSTDDSILHNLAYSTTRAALSVSNAVAQRAGLRRNTVPGRSPTGAVSVPFSAPFRRLQEAVTFHSNELEVLLGGAGLSLEDLTPFVCQQGDPLVSHTEPNALPVLRTPIVHLADRYVVASPAALLIALRHFLIWLAIKRGLRAELADRYHEAILHNVDRSVAMYLRCPPLDSPPFDFGPVPVGNRYYALDDDKVLNVMVTTDRLDEYVPASPFGPWDANGIVEHLQSRLGDVEGHVFTNTPPGKANEILHLIVVQGVGRSHSYEIHEREEPVRAYRVGLSGSDLESFGLRMRGQRLALWKFAEAAAAARASTKITSPTTLDEFAYFLANEKSYFSSDEAKPDVLVIPPGGGGALRCEAIQRFDFHAVPGPDGNRLVDVRRIGPELGIPSYIPVRPSLPVKLLSEALPVRIWLIGPESVDDERYIGWYWELATMLGYWLWQVSPSLSDLVEALTGRVDAIIIRIEVEPSEAWFVAGVDIDGGEGSGVTCRTDADEVHLHLAPSVMGLFERADNAGEREVLRAMLRALLEFGDLEAGPDVNAIVDQHAPVGPKKMILRLRAATNRLLDDRGISDTRPLQHTDVNAILDDTGRFLEHELRLPVGSIAPADRIRVLDAVIDHQFGALERLVATLNPKNLLETLVAHNEALVHGQALLRLTLPTRLACFADHVDVIGGMHRSRARLMDALVSSRFLIEYVAAQPPTGLRPMSLAVYDRLIAIVTELVDRCFARDVLALELADPELELLPSGRLGTERDKYEAAMQAWADDFAFGEVGRSQESFHRHWAHDSDTDVLATLASMDDPSRLEFGLTIRELLEFLAAAMEFGDQLAGAGKSASYADFLEPLTATLGWPVERVTTALDVFEARPRAHFFEPPPPYDRRHVSPSNFARPFSYLSRPFQLRPAPSGDQVVWGNRNLGLAGAYLVDSLLTGRYPARTAQLRAAMMRAQQAESVAFNDQVAEVFSAIPGTIVQKRVSTVGARRIVRKKGQDLGDIDVLVIEPLRRVVRAVEVKDFAGARTPWEFKREFDTLFRSTGGQSTIDKHGERVRWLVEHRAALLTSVGLPEHDGSAWRVEPLIVLDKESLTPFLATAPMPVTTYQRLKADIGEEKGD